MSSCTRAGALDSLFYKSFRLLFLYAVVAFEICTVGKRSVTKASREGGTGADVTKLAHYDCSHRQMGMTLQNCVTILNRRGQLNFLHIFVCVSACV